MGLTWGDLKKRVFSHLQLPRDTTGDVMEAVQEALHDTFLDITEDLNPQILFTSSSEVSLVGTANTLSIGTDFSITDMNELRAVTVDETPSDSNTEPIAWSEYPWENYQLNLNNLPTRIYSISPDDDTIYFSPAPESGVTWGVNLHYMKKVAAYDDAGEPELKDEFRRVLSYGAATMFPEYFGPERQLALTRYVAAFESGKKRIYKYQPKYKTLKRFRIKDRGRTRGGINFGTTIHT